jgi:hypothetical protein
MLAEIHYEVLVDGSIKIVDLVNFLDRKGIGNKFGEEVKRIYFGQSVYIEFSDFGGIGVRAKGIVLPKSQLYTGDIVSRKNFGKIVAETKAAGRKLCEIVEMVKNHVTVVRMVRI